MQIAPKAGLQLPSLYFNASVTHARRSFTFLIDQTLHTIHGSSITLSINVLKVGTTDA